MDQKRLKTKNTEDSVKEVACVKKAGTVLGVGAMAALAVGVVGIYALIGGSSIPKNDRDSAYVTESAESSADTESVEDQNSTVSQAVVTWKKAGIEEYSLVVETVKATKEAKNTPADTKKSSTAETTAKTTTSKKTQTTTSVSTENTTKASESSPETVIPEQTAPETETVKDCSVMTMYTEEKVNLRSGPSLNESVQSVLSEGCEVLVTGYTDDWYRVKTDNLTGYCLKRYLTDNKPEEEENEDTSASGGVISYTDVELNMLCYVLQGEVGDCSDQSKMAVANVIINRVKSPLFPDSIEGVLTQDGQFDAVWGYYSGSTVPSQNTIDCAKRALAGEDNVGDAVYYYAPNYCGADSAAWFESLTFCAEVEGQRFFY